VGKYEVRKLRNERHPKWEGLEVKDKSDRTFRVYVEVYDDYTTREEAAILVHHIREGLEKV